MSSDVGYWCNTSGYSRSDQGIVTPQFTTTGPNSIPKTWTVETYQA
jgi:hypothetical protein